MELQNKNKKNES